MPNQYEHAGETPYRMNKESRRKLSSLLFLVRIFIKKLMFFSVVLDHNHRDSMDGNEEYV